MDYDDLKALDLIGLAERFRDLKNELEDRKAETSILQKEFDLIRKELLPTKIEDSGLDTPVNLKGIGRISIRQELYTSIVADKKDEAYAWLEESGNDGLIKSTVNASTLKAFIKEQMQLGEEIPDDLFNVTPYEMATLTKG